MDKALPADIVQVLKLQDVDFCGHELNWPKGPQLKFSVQGFKMRQLKYYYHMHGIIHGRVGGQMGGTNFPPWG